MKTLVFALVVFSILKIINSVSKSSVYYMYRFLEVDAVKPEEFPDKVNKHKIIEKVQENFQLSESELQNAFPRAIQNLFTTIKGFESGHCLLVIDNWQNVVIQQTAAMPSILRNLKIAFSHRKLRHNHVNVEYLDQVLMPTKTFIISKNFSKYHLIDDKYHHCPISSFYAPLKANKKNEHFCANVVHEVFLLNSRPWQCEIQMSLLMPTHLLKNQRFPGFFQYFYCDYGDCDFYKFKFSPSLRPKIHIFLHLQKPHEMDSNNLLNWLTNFKHSEIGYGFKIRYASQNNVHFTGQVDCDVTKSLNVVGQTCDVTSLSYFNLCIDCPTFIVSTSLNPEWLSFKYIAIVDQIREQNLWRGEFNCELHEQKFSLREQIVFFGDSNPKQLMTPLKNLSKMKTKYSDNIQILAFAFTSVFMHLLGNFTEKRIDFSGICKKNCKWSSLRRDLWLSESIFDDRSNALRFENKFASVHFVSCGSRGLEGLKIKQFVSVLEEYVWKWILTIAVVLTVVMNLLRGSLYLINSLDKLTCLIKVVLEQGDPFPSRFIKSDAFRFLICGTLLGGLVLSNAFKSTNVYSIVLPKQPLTFSTMDELILHGYSVYTKLVSLENYLGEFQTIPPSTEVVIEKFYVHRYLYIFYKDDRALFGGPTELGSYYSRINWRRIKFDEILIKSH